MNYNGELRVIDTEKKAYLLGFLYGDGTITMYKKGNGNYIHYVTKLSIHEKDKELIFALQKEFPFFNLGEFDYSIYKENHGKQVYISKTSKELYNDLMLNGLFPRKSYENANKLRIPNIDAALLPHFIRGFFDADGSVYQRTERANLINIEFCSVSKEFITELDSYLKLMDIRPWKIIEKKSEKENRQIYYILSFIRTAEILKLINYMYADSSISLKRKADKCLSYTPVDKVLDRDMICTACDSVRINKNGVRGNSIRYKCRNCGQGFSIKNSNNIL